MASEIPEQGLEGRVKVAKDKKNNVDTDEIKREVATAGHLGWTGAPVDQETAQAIARSAQDAMKAKEGKK